MKRILIASVLFCASLFAASTPLHVSVDIFTNKAFLNKEFGLEKYGYISTKVPVFIKLSDLKYQIAKDCSIDKTSLSNKKEASNEQLQNLTKQKTQIQYELKAVYAKNELLKTLSLQNQADLSKVEQTSQFLAQNVITNLNKIDELQQKIADLDKKIASLQTLIKPFKELSVTYTCQAQKQKLTISYPQKEIKQNSFYNINANTNNKSVAIEKKVNIFYTGVENFSQIDINIYSYGFNKNSLPMVFYPRYIGGKKVVAYDKIASKPLMATPQQRNVVFHQLQTKSVYTIKNTHLILGENNLIDVDKKVLDANFQTIIDGYGTNRAYLQATITTKKDYASSTAKYFLNSKPISSRYLQRIQKGKETKLYFGEDEQIQITKKLIKTLSEKTFFGDKEISTQNWEYTLTNKKPFSTKISFLERVPVSKNGDIKVKVFAQPKENFQNAKGLIRWDFSLQPNEEKKIIFGYEISSSK